MKSKILRVILASLSCIGMLMPQVAFAVPSVTRPSDIALHDNDTIHGQVVDAQGAALAKELVTIYRGEEEIAQTQTDSTGKFSVAGMKGGVYQVAAAGHQGVYRLWAPRTAPPAAQQGLMVVSQGNVVRGQQGNNGPFQHIMSWISEHPIWTAAGVAAAIAIPIALDDDDSNTNS